MGKLLYIYKVKACTRNILVSVEKFEYLAINSLHYPFSRMLIPSCDCYNVWSSNLADGEASPTNTPPSARHEICKRQISKEARKTVVGRMQGTVQYSCVLQT